MAQYLLAIDNGTTMVKAAVFTTDGKELSAAGRKIEHVYPKPDWCEYDMNQLWDDNAAVIREAIEKAGVNPADIACVTGTGHGNGLYLTDADGIPVRPAIRGSDTRARQYIEDWTEHNTLDKIINKTTQSIWPLQPNGLLRWMQDHEPDVLARAAYFFCVKDYVRMRMTGEAYQEVTDMSGCSLMNVATGEYDDEVLDVWGISDCRRLFPPLKNSADVCGKVTAEAAAKTGLAEGTPVAGGNFDIDSCGLAVGMVDEDHLCMISGTWGNNQYITREPVVSKDVFMTSCYSIPGFYLVLEGSSTSASNLEWMVTEFFQADKELLKNAGDDKNVFELCSELVGSTDPKDSGIVFVPYLYQAPVSLDGKGMFYGLEGRHTRADVIRAVFEGIIFGHYWHVEKLLQFRDMPEVIRFTGGAARSEVWTQMFADIFQTTVEIPEGTELGALGASIVGAVAVGIYDSYESACDAMVNITRTYKPNPELAGVYAKKYARYKKLLEIFDDHWADLVWKVEE